MTAPKIVTLVLASLFAIIILIPTAIVGLYILEVRKYSHLELQTLIAERIENDPHGVIEARNAGGQSKRLVACSRDFTCPKRADAMFWIAADVLSNAGSALAAEDIAHSEFQRGLALMQEANEAGSYLAANELGLFYMDFESIQNLDRAEYYFLLGISGKDANSAYNMARLTYVREPTNLESVLKYLQMASEFEPNEFADIYMIILGYFGDSNDKKVSNEYFKDWRLERYYSFKDKVLNDF